MICKECGGYAKLLNFACEECGEEKKVMGAEKSRLLDLMTAVNADAVKERFRQNELYGVQRHSDGDWLAILMEEVGEVAQTMQIGSVASKPTDAQNKYKELIQVAAVAKAWAEQVREDAENNGEFV